MLYYNDLSPAQKRWVELVEMFCQDKIVEGKITHKGLKEIHQFFVEKRREDRRYKISWPIWLIMGNQVGRGVYQFPAPEIENDLEELVDEVTPIDPEKEGHYMRELIGFGITPKKDYFCTQVGV